MTIHDDLREVMGLLGKATPGPWKNNVNDDAHMGRLYGAPLADQSLPVLCKTWSAPSDTGLCCYVGTSQIQGMNNSAAIAAAVNFLRQHGPALLAAAKYEEANPLGGPATMLEAAARRIRAGEDFHEVLADYDLVARQEGEDARDAARYRVIRMYSVGANWPREFELAGIGAPAGLAAFGRTDPFATFSRHTLDGLMDDALGLLDGPKDVRPDYKEWRAASTADTLCKAKEVVDEAARSGGGG